MVSSHARYDLVRNADLHVEMGMRLPLALVERHRVVVDVPVRAPFRYLEQHTFEVSRQRFFYRREVALRGNDDEIAITQIVVELVPSCISNDMVAHFTPRPARVTPLFTIIIIVIVVVVAGIIKNGGVLLGFKKL